MMNKQYDWFATRIFQPELSLDELFDQGITPENTGFKTRDDYRNMASVRDQFRTEDGGFDEDAFNNAYNSSREMYNLYTNREYSKKLLEEFAYDPYEWYAPATGEIIDVSASNTPTKNGMLYSTNIAGIGENTESPYSVREIAQKQLVHDENGNQLDWTPEDKGGLLKGLLRDPLVLATYDEDTPEYDNEGNLIAFHKKGEYKYNEFGSPYYEKLGDRDAYGKEVLHYSDTLTKEGTFLNKLDFYDSDGKRKSVFGTAMKTASKIVPMFLHPAVGYTWGAINAAKGIGQSLAALSKGVDSIITGTDDNEFGRAMTKMENWLGKFDDSKSDYGKTHMWTSMETFGDLIGSTTKQLFEQRLIASIPKQLAFLGPKNMRSKMGQDLAIAYMAATSAKESYQAGIEAGLGDRQAGLLLLANTAAMWKLMDSDYGRSTLFKGSWFDDDIAKKTAKETADQMVKSGEKGYLQSEINKQMAEYGTTRMVVKRAKDAVDDAAKGLGDALEDKADDVIKSGTKALAKNAKKGGQEIAKEGAEKASEKAVSMWASSKAFLKEAYDKFSTNFKNKLEVFKGVADPEEYLAAMRNEAIEEVAEEAIMDATKATTLALEALGVKMNDTGKKLDYGFSGKDIFDRYLLSFLGGAIGGGIFRGYSAFERVRDNNWERVIPDYQKDLIFLIADGKGDEVIEQYKLLHKKGLLGSDSLQSDFKMSADDVSEVVGGEDLSQADANLKVLVGNVRFIEQVLNDEGIFDAIQKSKEGNVVTTRELIWRNDEYTEKQKRGLFLMHLVGAHQLMTHDFIKLGEDFVTAETWKTVAFKSLDRDNLTEEEKAQKQKLQSIYEERIKELRKRRDEILEGKYNSDYVASILLETEGVLPKMTKIGEFDKDRWSMSMYGRVFSALNPLLQTQVEKDLDSYFNRAYNFYGRNFAEMHDGTKRAFLLLQKRMRPEFEKQNETLRGKRINDFHSDNYFGEEYFRRLELKEKTEATLKEKVAKHQELSSKESPNADELAKLEEQIRTLQNNLAIAEYGIFDYSHVDGDPEIENKANFVPTSMLLKRFNNSNIDKLKALIESYHSVVTSDVKTAKETTANLLNQILTIYQEIERDNGLVQDLGELKMAEQAMIQHIELMFKNGIFNFDGTSRDITSASRFAGTMLSVNEDERNQYREQYENALTELLESLKSNKDLKEKYSIAFAAYQKMQDLVQKVIKDIESDSTQENLAAEGVNFDDALDFIKKAFYIPALTLGDVNVENPFDIFFKITDIVGRLNRTPISQILNAFAKEMDEAGNIKTSVAAFIENFFDGYISAKNWKDFIIANGDDQKLLKGILDVLSMMELLISVDDKTIETLNAFNDKENQFVVFDPIAKRNLLRNIDALKNKIYVVWQNGMRTSGNRHAEIEKDFKRRTINEVQNLLKFWGDIPEPERNEAFDIIAIWNDVIEGSVYQDSLSKIVDISANSLTKEQFVEFNSRILSFKSHLYKRWNAWTSDLNPEERAERFMQLFEKNPHYETVLLGQPENPYFKGEKGGINPVESFMYLMQQLSIDGLVFDDAYHKALTIFKPADGVGKPRIPNDEQESATHMAVAYLSNIDFWTAVRASLMKRIKSHSWKSDTKEAAIADYIKSNAILDNILIISGTGGVGKTTMIGTVLKEMWGNKSLVFNAAKKEVVEKFAAAFGASDKHEIVTETDTMSGKEALFKFLFGDDAHVNFEFKAGKDGDIYIDESLYPFLNSEKELAKLKKYSAILIDEVGQYNQIELKYINEIAKKAGIVVIGFGDHCQIGDIIEYKNEAGDKGKAVSSYTDTQCWRTPYLIRSMRDASIAKAINNERLGRSMYTIEAQIHIQDDSLNNPISSGVIDGTEIGVKLIHSDLLKNGMRGDQIIKTREEFDKVANHILKTMLEEDTISIIVDSKEKEDVWKTKLNALKLDPERYSIRRIDEKNQINGYETTYTIVDVDWKDRTRISAKSAWKDFYTISQRSYNASVFLDLNDELAKIHITSEFDEDSARMWSNNVEFVKQWYEMRSSLFIGKGITSLFADEDKFIVLNHSVDVDDDDKEKEKEKISVTPTAATRYTSASSTSSTKTPEEVLKEEEKREIEEIKTKRRALETSVSTTLNDLKEKGFTINADGTINSPFDVDAIKDIDDAIDKHTLIAEMISLVQNLKNVIQDSNKDVDLKNTISEDTQTTIDSYESSLIALQEKIVNKLSELNTVDLEKNITKIKEKVNESFSKIVTDDTTLPIIQRIETLKNNLRYVETIEGLLPAWTDAVNKSGDDNLKNELDAFIANLNETKNENVNKLSSLNAEISQMKLVFTRDNPDKFDSDKFDDFSILDKESISEIQKVIEEYKNALGNLDSINNENIEDLIEAKRKTWTNRISVLEDLITSLNASATSSTEIHPDIVNLQIQDVKLAEITESGTVSPTENIADLVINIINFCDNILNNSAITHEDKQYTEEVKKKWIQFKKDNPIFFTESDTEKQTDFEIKPTKGFEVNQTSSEDAKFSLDETQKMMEEKDVETKIEDKFTITGFEHYKELYEATKNGKEVYVWGLDLETTSKFSEKAELVQFGLVKYKITRSGSEWKIEQVSKTSEFVTPGTEGLTPPAEFDNGDINPIYKPWSDAESKWTEEKAIEHIFDTIGNGDYVITYNGKSYDFDVLARRGQLYGKTPNLLDNWKHIDVYADFITQRNNFGGDLLWNDDTGVPHTIGGLAVGAGYRRLETIEKQIKRQLKSATDSETTSHDAFYDVEATLDVMINIFNGIPIFLEEQKFKKSEFTTDYIGDDLYLNEVLVPYAKSLTDIDAPLESIIAACEKIRYKILSGQIQTTMKWEPVKGTNRSRLVCDFDVFESLPLFEVDGIKSGVYHGSFVRSKVTMSYGGNSYEEIIDLIKRNPNLRVSRPFVLTGLKGSDHVSSEELSPGALKFYDPSKTGGNLGKTFVLLSEDPNLPQNWDPTMALSAMRNDNGMIDWRNTEFTMLTVSRTAKLQDMIDFAIATSMLAHDKLGFMMNDYFENMSNQDAHNILGGITLSKTQYESLLSGIDVRSKLKLFNSPVFSVMDSRNVGEFLAAFVNGCILNPDVLNHLEPITGNEKITMPLHQWMFKNIFETLLCTPYYSDWKSIGDYPKYYSLALQVNGEEFKLVYNSSTGTEGFYLFKNHANLDLATQIQNIHKSKQTIETGFYFKATPNNLSSILFDLLQDHFGVKSESDLHFGEIKLETTNYYKNTEEIAVYPVSANEVFTRVFTTWSGSSSSAIGLRGWDQVYETIKKDMDGFQHDIFGHEIIDKVSKDRWGSTIFTPSVCTNSLNGEYKARSVKLTKYGGWTLKETADKSEIIKEQILNRIGKIQNSVSKEFLEFIKTKLNIDGFVQNSSNLDKTKDELNAWFTKEVNRLAREFYKDEDIIEVLIVDGDTFEIKSRFKKAADLPETTEFDKKYYWVDTVGTEQAYIGFENGIPVSFNIRRINELTTPYVLDLTQDDVNISLLRNILLTLWDSEFALDERTRAGYLRYFMAQVRGINVDSKVKERITKSILKLNLEQKDSIFTEKIKKDLLAKDPTLAALYDVYGNDFYGALEDSLFDIFGLIEQMCN